MTCKPQFSADLQQGIENQIDLKIRPVKKGFAGDISIFEGYRALPCREVALNKVLFKIEAGRFGRRSLRQPASARNGKPLEKLRGLIK